MVNIYVSSSGGNGYILATQIISEAALRTGYSVKNYIEEGLVQRNGEVYGEVRIGRDVLTGQIPMGCADVMLGLEPLETYRKSVYLKDCAPIILNSYRVYPARCIYQEEEYPNNIIEELSKKYCVIPVDFYKVTSSCLPVTCTSNYKIRTFTEFIPRKLLFVNTYCIGILAKLMTTVIPYCNWINAINLLVPTCVLEENLLAFEHGYADKNVPVCDKFCI